MLYAAPFPLRNLTVPSSWLVLLIPLICVSVLQADSSEKLLKAVARAEELFNTNADKIAASVLTSYDIAIEAARKQGNFELLDKLNDDRQDFETNHKLPKLIPELKYRQSLSLACDRCLKSFDDAISSTTKSKDLELAESIQKKKEAFIAKVDRTFPGARIFRKTWKHPIGKFSTTDGVVWIEKTPTNTFSYRETGRNLDCVYLYDQSRNLSIVLTETCCTIKRSKDKAKVAYFGSWTE